MKRPAAAAASKVRPAAAAAAVKGRMAAAAEARYELLPLLHSPCRSMYVWVLYPCTASALLKSVRLYHHHRQVHGYLFNLHVQTRPRQAVPNVVQRHPLNPDSHLPLMSASPMSAKQSSCEIASAPFRPRGCQGLIHSAIASPVRTRGNKLRGA